MAIKDSKTEQLIKDTAKQVFFKDGKISATTQEIADAAGVNRSLLHYYFRSRDMLFDLVFKESLMRLRERLHNVIISKDPVRTKVENIIDAFVSELIEAPYLETFIVLHMNKHPECFEQLFSEFQENPDKLKNFMAEIQLEMDAGNFQKMEPIQFFINLFSLMSYPFIAKPLYQNMFDLSDDDYNNILSKRKDVIMSLLFK